MHHCIVSLEALLIIKSTIIVRVINIKKEYSIIALCFIYSAKSNIMEYVGICAVR